MKKGIHPNWTAQAQVTCSCGNIFTVGSTFPTLQVDICSKCHPFFTGEMKFVDRQGRVQKFQAKLDAAKQNQATAKAKSKKADDKAPVQSYQDILRNQQAVIKSEEKAKKAEVKA